MPLQVIIDAVPYSLPLNAEETQSILEHKGKKERKETSSQYSGYADLK